MPLLNPASLAIIVASNADTARAVPRLLAEARADAVVVCPKQLSAADVAGLRVVRHLRDLTQAPELAVVAGRGEPLAQAVHAVARAGARFIVAAGPLPDPDELAEACAAAGAALLGPASLGIVHRPSGLDLLIAESSGPRVGTPRALEAGVAIVSDAGHLDAALLAEAQGATYIGLGEAGLTAAEALRECAAAETVQAVLLRLVHPRAAAALVTAARACPKPVLVMAYDSGKRELYESAGMIAVPPRPRAAVAAAVAWASGRSATGRATAVIGRGAGSTAALAQAARHSGQTQPILLDETVVALRGEALLHATVSQRGVVDLTDQAEARHVVVAVEALARDPGVDIIVADGIASAALGLLETPVVTVADAGGFREAVEVAAALSSRRTAEVALELPTLLQPELAQTLIAGAAIAGQAELAGDDARRVLAAVGLACAGGMRVTSPHAARRVAADTGFPVWLFAEETPYSAQRRVPTGLLGPYHAGDSLESGLLEAHERLTAQHGDVAFSVTTLPERAPRVAVAVRSHPLLGHVLEMNGSRLALPPLRSDCARVARALMVPDAAVCSLIGRLAALVDALPELATVALEPVVLAETPLVVGARLGLGPELLDAARRPPRYVRLSSEGRVAPDSASAQRTR